MNRVVVTLAAVRAYNLQVAQELSAKVLQRGLPVEEAAWVYEWSHGRPQYRAQDHIRSMAQGRVYTPQPSEADVQVTLRVETKDGKVLLASRQLSRVPNEVRRQVR